MTVIMGLSGISLDGFAALAYAAEGQEQSETAQEQEQGTSEADQAQFGSDKESDQNPEAATMSDQILSDDSAPVSGITDSDTAELGGSGAPFELSTTFKTSDGSKWTITGVFGENAGIPVDAVLVIEDINQKSYNSYLKETAKVLRWQDTDRAEFARFFNISIESKGKIVKPAADIEFTVKSKDVKKNIELIQVVHYGDFLERKGKQKEKSSELECAVTEKDELVFATKKLGAFGFVTYEPSGLKEQILKNGNVTISGMMPEDAEMTAVDASGAKAVKATTKKGGTTLAAYDITIDDSGSEYQPDADHPIQVEIANKAITKDSNLNIWHLKDDGSKEIVEDFTAEEGAVIFEATGFSIYVVGEEETPKRIAYSFYNGSTVITTEHITKIEEFYDPGISPEYGQTFLGWAYNSAETDESHIYSWEQLKTDLAAKLTEQDFEDSEEIKVYARFKEAYYLRYMVMESNGSVGVLKSDNVRMDATDKTITVNCEYSVAGEEFEGWIDAATGDVYVNGDTVTLDHHMDVYAIIRGQYWLVFNANTKGATFTGPQLIHDGSVTQKPADPSKKGYEFIGWNTQADGNGDWWYKSDGTANLFGETINEETTLYAQWEGSANSYTIVYWKQKASATPEDHAVSDYEYVESQTVTGVHTGDVITALPAGYNTKASIDETSNYYQTEYGWTDWNNEITVSAEGDTVVNVYYNRKAYHLYFQVEDYTYTVSTNDNDNNPEKYGDVNGQKARVYWRNGAFRTRDNNNGTVYSGTVYTRSNNQSWQTIKDIYAIYEHDVSDQFPIVGTNGVTYGSGQRWKPQNDAVWTEVMVLVASMPNRNVTFHLDTSSNPTKYMSFYVEALPGQTPNITYNGKGYVKYADTISANYYGVTIEDRLELAGYEAGTVIGGSTATNQYNNVLSPTYRSVTDWWGNTTIYSTGGNFYGFTINNNNTIATYVNFLYTRKTHDIDFRSVGENVTSNSTQTVRNVPFGAKVTDYIPAPPTNGKEGYYFDGWYQDQASLVPLTDDVTMPDSNAVFYAKWDTYRVRVALEPNCSDFWFANNQALSFRTDYGESVSFGNIKPGVAQRPGYKLTGWYYSENFDPNTLMDTDHDLVISNNIQGVNMDYQSTSDWANNTYGDNDGAHYNVKGLLKLYARWQLDINENAVYFLYEVDDGYCIFDASGANQTTIPVDATAHLNGTTFQIADAPSGYVEGVDFKNWMVLDKNGGATSVTHDAGNTITLIESEWTDYIDTITVYDNDGNVNTMKVVRLRARFTANEDKATSITFHGNGGTMDNGSVDYTQVVPLNASVDLNVESAAFSREHYSLVSWNTKADGSGKTFKTTDLVYANNDGIEPNDLYAMWQADIEVVAKGPEEEVIYDGKAHSNTKPYTFSITLGGNPVEAERTEITEDGVEYYKYTYDGLVVKIKKNGWPVATGTAKGTYIADNLTDAQLEDLISIDRTNYSDDYNVRRTYTPAKLIIRDLILTITKEVTGDFAEKNRSYTFTLTSVEGMSSGSFCGEITRKGTGSSGDVTYSATFVIGATFQMHEGDTVKIEGLPKDKNVVFTEEDGYYKTYWKLNGGVESQSSSTTIQLTEDSALAIRNHYFTPAPTGYASRQMPYICMGLLALLLLAVMVIGRRRRSFSAEGMDAADCDEVGLSEASQIRFEDFDWDHIKIIK